MPDFETMTDAELRTFKSQKWHAIQALRTEMRAAEAVLQRKRAEAEFVAALTASVKAGAVVQDAVVEAPPAGAASTGKGGVSSL